MPRMNFSLTGYEGAVLWRFFDSVSSAVSIRMLRGSPPGEENLTFLLCELLDELMEMGFPLFFGGRNTIASANQEDEDKAREWRARQPALRISALDTILSQTEKGGAPRLKPLYDALVARSDRIAFSPLADFLLLALANSRYGNSNEQWVQLAEGEDVSIPQLKQGSENQSSTLLDGLRQAPIPRHTIRVNVRSTLPRSG